MNWYLKALKKYAVFSGRASRKEFWMFVLFDMIFAIIAMIIDDFITVTTLYILVLLTPVIAVTVRRMHDIGKSGWMLLLSFIPIMGIKWENNDDYNEKSYSTLIPLVGPIWVLILLALKSKEENNEYGEN